MMKDFATADSKVFLVFISVASKIRWNSTLFIHVGTEGCESKMNEFLQFLNIFYKFIIILISCIKEIV